MVSYSATSKTLSGRSDYFFRTSVPDSGKALQITAHSSGFEGLLSTFEWTHIGVVSTAKSYGTTMASDVMSSWTDVQGVAAGHEVMFNRQVDTESAGWNSDNGQLKEVLKDLQASGVRVVVICGHTNDVGDILQKVGEFNIGTTVTGTTWIATTDSLPAPTVGSLGSIMQGTFAVTAPEPTGSYTSPFQTKYAQLFASDASFAAVDSDGDPSTLHTYSYNVHDAVMAVAVAFDAMISPSPPPPGVVTLRDHIEAVDFLGVSGDVAFDDNHDRAEPKYDVKNLQSGTGSRPEDWALVGALTQSRSRQVTYSPTSTDPVWSDPEVVFPDIPVDYVEPPLPAWAWALIIFMAVMMCGGTTFALRKRYLSKKKNAARKLEWFADAQKDKEKALAEQAKRLDDAKRDIDYPVHWQRVPGTVSEAQPLGMPVNTGFCFWFALF